LFQDALESAQFDRFPAAASIRQHREKPVKP